MSFRRRFITIIALSIVMLVATCLTFIQLREEGDEQREVAARERGAALVAALLHQLEGQAVAGASTLAPEAVRSLTAFVDDVIAQNPDASAGLCARDGSLLLSRSVEPPRLPPGPTGMHPGARVKLLPADRDVATRVCQASVLDRPTHERLAMPRDVLLACAQASGDTLAAWSIVRLPPFGNDAQRARLRAKFAVMGLASLALLGLTVSALLALHRGARALDSALLRLQGDLRADVGRPRALELGRIADGLRAMANHLADARDHERALERRLERDQRLAGLGRVVAGVAHEVRNPITGIKLKLDGLARRGLDARSSEDVRICLQEIARLDRVVSSMLLVARDAPTERAEVDVGALLRERLAQSSALASKRGVDLRLAGAASLTTNGEALTRIVDNLLRNAIEASPEGGAVDVRAVSDEAGVRIEIIDRGPGIPEARLHELYEPFFSMKPEGTGLGLFLSRTLVKGLGARLAYERRADTTAFVVHFAPGAAEG
jgi:signal transduction histidine kinase